MDTNNQDERRRSTDVDEERLAKRVADELFHKLYEEIGKSILKKVMWLAVIVLFVVALKVGIVKLP